MNKRAFQWLWPIVVMVACGDDAPEREPILSSRDASYDSSSSPSSGGEPDAARVITPEAGSSLDSGVAGGARDAAPEQPPRDSGAVAADTGTKPADAGASSGDDAGQSVPRGGGLRVVGNQIVTADGMPFHGRGANLGDTRNCDACSTMPANPQGVNRWADELLDKWKANFVRFLLEAITPQGSRVQWKSLLEDAAYRADIKNMVSHMTSKPGVYVMTTLFRDPSIQTQGNEDAWPTAQSVPVYKALAELLVDDPSVLFGLTNEPHGPANQNPELAQRYLAAIDAIRAVEKEHGVPEHIIVVQAPQGWSRDLSYFVQNPLGRSNIAYEVHAYNARGDFDKLLRQPKQKLPIVVGEYGPVNDPNVAVMTDDDIRALWELCQELNIPHIGWMFHMRCPPNMLVDSTNRGCGLTPTFNFARTPWGNLLYDYFATPW